MSLPPDPYAQQAHLIQEPPKRFVEKLRFLGPGFVLSASIVGSGELIATTYLGAQAGFICMWVILVSCLVKVIIQLEFGKHAIYSGESVMAAFNRLPGPRFGQANWSIWTWLSLMALKFLQVGGIIGAVAITVNLALGTESGWVPLWTLLLAISVSLLVFRGSYRFVERFSLVMIGLFTLFTFACLGALQYTEYAISWSDLASGLSFQLPADTVVLLAVLGAFGLTGVGGDEIMFYNYWCLEKGYAAFTGPRNDSPEWEQRAKGWIQVMYLDAVLAMLVYTLVTAAFYMLGAAVLHQEEILPEKDGLMDTLSSIYTISLGSWAKIVFLIGAFVVLFSTLFGALAAWIRIFTDAFGQVGWLDFFDQKQRQRSYTLLAWSIPLVWGLLYHLIGRPTLMVMIGGVITSVILFIVVFAAWHFRYRRLPASLTPARTYDFAFWLSATAIVGVGVYGLWDQLLKVMA